MPARRVSAPPCAGARWARWPDVRLGPDRDEMKPGSRSFGIARNLIPCSAPARHPHGFLSWRPKAQRKHKLPGALIIDG